MDKRGNAFDELAKDHTESRLTKEAKAAWERIKSKDR